MFKWTSTDQYEFSRACAMFRHRQKLSNRIDSRKDVHQYEFWKRKLEVNDYSIK